MRAFLLVLVSALVATAASAIPAASNSQKKNDGEMINASKKKNLREPYQTSRADSSGGRRLDKPVNSTSISSADGDEGPEPEDNESHEVAGNPSSNVSADEEYPSVDGNIMEQKDSVDGIMEEEAQDSTDVNMYEEGDLDCSDPANAGSEECTERWQRVSPLSYEEYPSVDESSEQKDSVDGNMESSIDGDSKEKEGEIDCSDPAKAGSEECTERLQQFSQLSSETSAGTASMTLYGVAYYAAALVCLLLATA